MTDTLARTCPSAVSPWRHFIADGPAFHEIPLERLYGPGVVWRIDAEPYGVIEADTLARGPRT